MRAFFSRADRGLFPRARGSGCRAASRIAHVAMINTDPAVAPVLRRRAFELVSGAVRQHLSTAQSQGVLLRFKTGARNFAEQTSPQSMLSPADPPCLFCVGGVQECAGAS